MTWNAQIAHNFNKNIRAYFGGENLTGTRQKNPIVRNGLCANYAC